MTHPVHHTIRADQELSPKAIYVASRELRRNRVRPVGDWRSPYHVLEVDPEHVAQLHADHVFHDLFVPTMKSGQPPVLENEVGQIMGFRVVTR